MSLSLEERRKARVAWNKQYENGEKDWQVFIVKWEKKKAMKPKRKPAKRKATMSLTTCSGSGRALKKSPSKGVRKAASKKLNTTCKKKAAAKRKTTGKTSKKK